MILFGLGIWFYTIICLSNWSCELGNSKLKINKIYVKSISTRLQMMQKQLPLFNTTLIANNLSSEIKTQIAVVYRGKCN